MADFNKILSGGDLRSIGESNSIIRKIRNQKYTAQKEKKNENNIFNSHRNSWPNPFTGIC